jgi:hypothetical protein
MSKRESLQRKESQQKVQKQEKTNNVVSCFTPRQQVRGSQFASQAKTKTQIHMYTCKSHTDRERHIAQFWRWRDQDRNFHIRVFFGF